MYWFIIRNDDGTEDVFATTRERDAEIWMDGCAQMGADFDFGFIADDFDESEV